MWYNLYPIKMKLTGFYYCEVLSLGIFKPPKMKPNFLRFSFCLHFNMQIFCKLISAKHILSYNLYSILMKLYQASTIPLLLSHKLRFLIGYNLYHIKYTNYSIHHTNESNRIIAVGMLRQPL